MIKKLLIIFAIVGVPSIIVVAILFSEPPTKPPVIDTPSSAPTAVKNGTTTLGGLVLCKEYQKIENEISCEEAIRIATAKYPGIVREIDRENNFRFNSPDQARRDLWRLEIKLNTPVTIGQTTLNGVRLFLDRKSAEELRKRYRNIQ